MFFYSLVRPAGEGIMPADTHLQMKPPTKMTPLWVIALFLSLTEMVLGVATTQTSGSVQVALVVFVIAFPLLVAGAFFSLLWLKPWSFYPPSEYHNVDVQKYVEALRGEPVQIVKQTEDVRGPLEVFGYPDRLKLLFKAAGETWVRSTKAMDVGRGCVVQVSTQFLTPQGVWNLAEAVTYVPGATIIDEEGGGRYLVQEGGQSADGES